MPFVRNLVHGKKKLKTTALRLLYLFPAFHFSLTFEDTKRGAQPLKNLLKITSTLVRVFTSPQLSPCCSKQLGM